MGIILVFLFPLLLQNSKGTLQQMLNTRGGKILWFSTEISIYLRNSKRYGPMVTVDH